jgi:sugar fermentation stimulation protein A
MDRPSELVGVRFAQPLVPARFIRRLNRFAALVRVEGREERVHVRNSGRLRELLTPERRVWLEPATGDGRGTRFTLALVFLRRGYVSADAHLPNALVEAGLRRGAVPGCGGYRLLRREPAMGQKRADFLLARAGRHCLVEVKSVTLIEAGIAVFPDAPTARGRAHLEHLIAARRRDMEAVVLFVIQRADAVAFAPNRRTDPAFAAALGRAVRAGVRVRAVTCHVTRREVRLGRCVPVRLPSVRARGSVGKSCPVREMG